MDFNSIYDKLVLRENKKRKTCGACTSKEEPIPNKVDDDEFWDNLEINEEEAWAYQEDEAPEEETQPPPNQPRNL